MSRGKVMIIHLIDGLLKKDIVLKRWVIFFLIIIVKRM